MTFKEYINAAIDKQWPRPSAADRADYLRRRAVLDGRPAPRWQYLLAVLALSVIPLVYCVAANAGPVIVAPLSAAAAVAQRNNEPKPEPEVWKDGPCKGHVRGSCTWFVNGVEQK